MALTAHLRDQVEQIHIANTRVQAQLAELELPDDAIAEPGVLTAVRKGRQPIGQELQVAIDPLFVVPVELRRVPEAANIRVFAESNARLDIAIEVDGCKVEHANIYRETARKTRVQASCGNFRRMRFAEVLRSTNDFDQEVLVHELADRRPLFIERCAGRSVLHVGCCDVPFFDADTNLHLALAPHTDRLDGLDVSQEGIEVLRRHVDGEYFTSAARITRQYDVLLAPEVIEHTANPEQFLSELFSVRAAEYLISAPHYQWFEQSRREAGVFHEKVHPDHRAWYSPYTLLRTLRAFIDEAQDDVEVFLFKSTGSVAVAISKPFTPAPFAGRQKPAALSAEAGLSEAEALLRTGNAPAALSVLEATQTRFADPRLLQAQVGLLLGMGQNLEGLRRGVAWLRDHPDDAACLLLCADAAEALGDRALAEQWRAQVPAAASKPR